MQYYVKCGVGWVDNEGMQCRKPVAIGMRVMHQIVRCGGDTVPLGGIAEARDCFRCITQIGP